MIKRLRFNLWIELRGPARLWAASITFTVLGALIAFGMPRVLATVEQEVLGLLALRALGWTFLILGLFVLLLMLVTLYVRIRQPEQEPVWHWWINFVGGLLGALAFAIPASLMFPMVAVAYWTRPNPLFPPDADVTQTLWLGAMFSIVGVVTCVATFLVARIKLREDPSQGV